MLWCPYCGQRATMKVVANPENVCFDHALEFWRGLLAFARDSKKSRTKPDRLYSQRREVTGAARRRAIAIAYAGPPPGARDPAPIRLAS